VNQTAATDLHNLASVYQAEHRVADAEPLFKRANEAKVDLLGRFELPVAGREGDSVRIRIYAGRELVYDDRQTLPGPVTLKLHRSKGGS
jgi:hypothetical protein